MIPRFFGNSKQPLFGIYHPARGRKAVTHPVVLCPPIGNEYVRTHWALRSLATKLARVGCSVLRFDYRGTGDSSGDVSEVASVSEWVEDTCEASLELVEECGQTREPVTLVGLRWGAAVACMAAKELAETHSITTKLVLWDPVLVGADYLTEQRAMHHEMLDLWISKVETENSANYEELLGFQYHRNLIDEIEATDLNASTRPAEQISLIHSRKAVDVPSWNLNGNSRQYSEEAYDWDDLRYIEEAWLPGKSSNLVRKAIEQQPATVQVGSIGADQLEPASEWSSAQ